MWERQLCSHPIYPAVANSNNDWQPKPTVVFATQDPGDVIASTDAQAAPYVILSTTPINVDKLPRARLDATAKWYIPVPKVTQNQQPTTREAGSIWTDDTAAEVEEVPPEEGQQQPEEYVTTGQLGKDPLYLKFTVSAPVQSRQRKVLLFMANAFLWFQLPRLYGCERPDLESTTTSLFQSRMQFGTS